MNSPSLIPTFLIKYLNYTSGHAVTTKSTRGKRLKTKGKIILSALVGTALGAQAVYAHDAGQTKAG